MKEQPGRSCAIPAHGDTIASGVFSFPCSRFSCYLLCPFVRSLVSVIKGLERTFRGPMATSLAPISFLLRALIYLFSIRFPLCFVVLTRPPPSSFSPSPAFRFDSNFFFTFLLFFSRFPHGVFFGFFFLML